MPEIRAFLAIDLDEDLKPKINKIIKSFKEIDANIKYVDLANLHFTLKFFGDIDVEGIDLLSQHKIYDCKHACICSNLSENCRKIFPAIILIFI